MLVFPGIYRIKRGKKKMKIDELPESADRIQLAKIQRFLNHLGGRISLKATGEAWQEGGKNKTEGLKIHLVTIIPYETNFDMSAEDGKEITSKPVVYEDGLPVTQLYGKMASKELKIAMGALSLDDTEQLQEDFYWYRLVAMPQGYARLMPFEKV